MASVVDVGSNLDAGTSTLNKTSISGDPIRKIVILIKEIINQLLNQDRIMLILIYHQLFL